MNTKSLFFLGVGLIILCACQSKQKSSEVVDTIHQPMDYNQNLLKELSKENQKGFSWMNEPESFDFANNSLQVSPKANSDYFNDPASGKITGTAPLIYREVAGDFVATTRATPNFKDIWNACALMVYQDSTYWGKLCFENSDATGPSVVTVVTKETSDDSNGPIIHDKKSIWLRIARKDDLYAMYWSLDGVDYKMARLFSLPPSDSIKIGMIAQCPAGVSVIHEFDYFSLEKKTLKDMRKGI